MIPGSASESSAAAPSTGGAPQGGLAGALQDALKQRKQRVSGSGKCRIFIAKWILYSFISADDEKDDDDDW